MTSPPQEPTVEQLIDQLKKEAHLAYLKSMELEDKSGLLEKGVSPEEFEASEKAFKELGFNIGDRVEFKCTGQTHDEWVEGDIMAFSVHEDDRKSKVLIYDNSGGRGYSDIDLMDAKHNIKKV